MVEYQSLNVESKIKEKFEKLRSDLRFHKKIIKSQSELLDMLINSYRLNFNRKQ